MTLQPGWHAGMLVRAIVGPHQAPRDIAGEFLVQTPPETYQFLVAMLFEARADHTLLQNFQSREQGRGPIPLVVVRHRAAATFLDPQARWRAIQSLNLALLVYTQNDRLLRRFRYSRTTSVNFS